MKRPEQDPGSGVGRRSQLPDAVELAEEVRGRRMTLSTVPRALAPAASCRLANDNREVVVEPETQHARQRQPLDVLPHRSRFTLTNHAKERMAIAQISRRRHRRCGWPTGASSTSVAPTSRSAEGDRSLRRRASTSPHTTAAFSGRRRRRRHSHRVPQPFFNGLRDRRTVLPPLAPRGVSRTTGPTDDPRRSL